MSGLDWIGRAWMDGPLNASLLRAPLCNADNSSYKNFVLCLIPAMFWLSESAAGAALRASAS